MSSSGCSLFFANNEDNIASEKELKNLVEFTEEFKTERWNIMEKPVQRNLISQL